MRSGFGWRHMCPVLQQGTRQAGASGEGKHRKAFPHMEASLPHQPQDLYIAAGLQCPCSDAQLRNVLGASPLFSSDYGGISRAAVAVSM